MVPLGPQESSESSDMGRVQDRCQHAWEVGQLLLPNHSGVGYDLHDGRWREEVTMQSIRMENRSRVVSDGGLVQ